MTDKINLLTEQEQNLHLIKVAGAMRQFGIKTALVSSRSNIFYLTGRVFSGYIFITADATAPVYLVKRPVHLCGERVLSIHKPELIPEALAKLGITECPDLAFELGNMSYNTVTRLAKAMGCTPAGDIGTAMSMARATKTPYEISRIKESGVRHAEVYRHIPHLYRPGMTDIELQIEIERLSRLEGCLGQFRMAGEEMDLFMGNVLAGDNADAPSPFDFAMGGAGIAPSLPIGADGTIIKPGMSVMVDMNGNFNGYMTDMTRCYSCGTISDKARQAHQLSIDICNELQRMGRPGVEARALYERAAEMASEAGLADYFMGHRQHAGFVGHGIGIDVNELPVLAPRSRNILSAGNVIAIEPKFVIPGTGAVGIENTYLVKEDGEMECLTACREELVPLD